MKYEESAEFKENISGWICKNCGRFYGSNEHLARYCCADELPCNTEGCNGRAKKPYMYCNDCQQKIRIAAHDKKMSNAETVEYSGPFMVDNSYYADVHEYLTYCYEQGYQPEEFLFVPYTKDLVPSFDCIMDYLTEGSELEEWDAECELNGIKELKQAWITFQLANKDRFSYWEGKEEKVDIREDIKEFEQQDDFEGWNYELCDE